MEQLRQTARAPPAGPHSVGVASLLAGEEAKVGSGILSASSDRFASLSHHRLRPNQPLQPRISPRVSTQRHWHAPSNGPSSAAGRALYGRSGPSGRGRGQGRPLFPLAFKTPSHTKPPLTAENLALWQQSAGLESSAKKPKLRQREGILWVWRPISPGTRPGSATGSCQDHQTFSAACQNTVPHQTSPHSRESRLMAAVGGTGTLRRTAQAPPAGAHFVGVASHPAGDRGFGTKPAPSDRSSPVPQHRPIPNQPSQPRIWPCGSSWRHQAPPAGAHSVGIASHLAGKEVAVGVAGWARTRWKHSLSAGRGSWDHTGITGSPLPSRTPFQTKPALTAENLALRQ